MKWYTIFADITLVAMIRRFKMSLFRTSLMISYLALIALLHLPKISANTSSNNKGYVREKRKMIKGIERRWPNNIVPYTMTGLSATVQKKITDAIEHWSKYTCLTFKTAKRGERKIKFIKSTNGGTSSSTFGYNITYDTIIKLPSWTSRGSVLHEIGHALGFFHEHSRPDRDDYITVLHTGGGYQKIDYMNTHDMPYDYLSIMHYPKKLEKVHAILPKTGTYRPLHKIKKVVVSQNSSIIRRKNAKYISTKFPVIQYGEHLPKGKYRISNSNDTHIEIKKKYGPVIGFVFKPTTDPREAEVRRKFEQIGQRNGLSFLDRKLANHVYRCSAPCHQKPCPGEGFLDKNCVCQCDSGQAGMLLPCMVVTTPPLRPKCRPNSRHDHDDCEAWAAKGECNKRQYKKWMMEYCPASCGECIKIKKLRPKLDKIERQPSTSFTMKCRWTTTVGGKNSQLLVKYRAPETKLRYNVCRVKYPGLAVKYFGTYPPNQHITPPVNDIGRADCRSTRMKNKPSGHVFFTLSNLTLNDTGTYSCTYKLKSVFFEGSVVVSMNKTASECFDKYNKTRCEHWKRKQGCDRGVREFCARTCGICDIRSATCMDDSVGRTPQCTKEGLEVEVCSRRAERRCEKSCGEC